MNAIQGLPAQAWVQHLGWTLVQFLWQGTLVSVLFAIVRGLFRRRMTAHARYILACATLGLMVMAPGLTFLVRVRVPLMPAWPAPSPEAWRSVLPWLVAAWLCGVAVFSARLIGGWRVTARLRSVGVRPAQLEWQRRLEDLIRRVRVSRPVRLLVSSLVEVPVVVGWWRPVILVPVGALTGLPPAHVEALLAHELAHIRRLDYLINILQSLAEAALFYHPAVWWVSDQIRAERELCCDDLAIAVSGDVLTYAHALAELESYRPAHTHALAASGGSLLDRIRRLLGHATPASHALPGPGAAVAMSLLWLLGVGAVGTHAAPRSAPLPLPSSPSRTAALVASSPHPILSTLLFGPLGPAVEQQPTPNAPQPASKTTASLAGVITAADSGKPIRRAHVSITADELRSARSVLTDDAGKYVFTDLPAGRYTVTASRAGYFDAIFGQKLPQHPGTPVTLAEGQKLDRINIRLLKGGVIVGTLLDENGDPAPPATPVRAMRFDMTTGEKVLVTQASGITDDRGVYRIYNLPAGNYLVVAVPRLDTESPPQNGGRAGGGGRGAPPPPDPTPATGQDPRIDYVPVYFPGTTNASAATAITVGLGEERSGNDFQLQLMPIAKLEGTIVGMGPNALLQGFSMQLVNADAQPGLPRTSGSSSVFGSHFTFESVAPGRYVIEVRTTRPATTGGPPVGTSSDFTSNINVDGRNQVGTPGPAAGGHPIGVWGDLTVIVDGHNQDNLIIPLQDGITMTGHLSVDLGASGTPDFSVMRVSLTPQTTEQSGGRPPMVPRAVADASGRFSIRGIVPGTYTLNVAGPGGWMAKSVMVAGKDALDFGLQVEGGAVLDDVAVVLTNKSTQLSGIVMDADRRPLADETVIVFAADAKYWVPQSRRIQAMRPGTDGKFIVRGLPAGDYVIAAVADIEQGQWYDPALLERLKAAGTPIHLEDGDQKTQDLRIAAGGS